MEPISALFLFSIFLRRALGFDETEFKQVRDKLRWADNSQRFNHDPAKRDLRNARYKRYHDKHKKPRAQKIIKGDTTLSHESLDARESVRNYFFHRGE